MHEMRPYYYRFKFSRKVRTNNKDTETIAFTNEYAIHKSDERSFVNNRVDDNTDYHEFRDELLVLDSIMQ